MTPANIENTTSLDLVFPHCPENSLVTMTAPLEQCRVGSSMPGL